jgi:hypothetical protein
MPAVPFPSDPTPSRAHPRPDEHEMMSLLPQLAARIEARYPSASIQLVERCLVDAVQHYHDSRVRSFLPVLVERRAARAVAAALEPAVVIPISGAAAVHNGAAVAQNGSGTERRGSVGAS